MKKIVFLIFSIFCYKNNFLNLKADRIYKDETHSDIIKYFLDKEKGRPNYLKKLDLNKFYRSIVISYNEDLSREQLIEYAQTIHKRDDVYAVSLNQIGEWANTISNDTFYNYNSSIFDDYCIPHAWDITTSKHSVKVGIIDDYGTSSISIYLN